MNDCIFCKVIAKELPSTVLYEDDTVLAILDIHPVNPGHVVVLPKRHCEGVHDADATVLQSIILVVQKIAVAVMAATDAEGFNIHQNNGKIAGQAIPHLHFHVIPRHSGDGLQHWPGKSYEEGSAAAIAQKIRAELGA